MAETKRHIVRAGSAVEITRAIGATEEDIRLVNQTFVALGYRDARTGKFVTIEAKPRASAHRAARKIAPKKLTGETLEMDTTATHRKGK